MIWFCFRYLVFLQSSFEFPVALFLLFTPFYLFQPFLNSLDKGQIKMRVMPHFPMESTMLRVDGVSMTTAATASFLTFLASQISDLVSYFVSRNERSQGEVVLDENSNEPPLPVQLQVQSTPPPPPMGTPGSFGSWNFPDYTTPLADPPVPPVSGVY